MRRAGEIRVVRGPADEALEIGVDLLAMIFCVGLMLCLTFLPGSWL